MIRHCFVQRGMQCINFVVCFSCSELRLKDIERVQKHLDGVKALEKRGFTKEQKEELVICQKVLDWLNSGKDAR